MTDDKQGTTMDYIKACSYVGLTSGCITAWGFVIDSFINGHDKSIRYTKIILTVTTITTISMSLWTAYNLTVKKM
jgi:hypothetical protein